MVFKVKQRYNEIYGIDISPYRIDEEKRITLEKNINNIHFLVCNINEKVDFSDSTFDAVIALAVIEHIFAPYFVINEIHRVLKNGEIFSVRGS